MDKNDKQRESFWVPIIFIGIGIVIGSQLDNDVIKIRYVKSGIDTVYSQDSGYVVNMRLIKAFEIEKEYEPMERP